MYKISYTHPTILSTVEYLRSQGCFLTLSLLSPGDHELPLVAPLPVLGREVHQDMWDTECNKQ